jgi:uncharacterized protein
MKVCLLLFSLLLSYAVGIGQTTTEPSKPEPREFEMKGEDTTYIMKRYVMVLLVRPENAPTYSEEESKKLQEGHLANITRLANEGKLLVAGPFGDDTALRGIFILDVGSVEEAKVLVETDPAVQAGRLKPEYHPWWCAKGTTLK